MRKFSRVENSPIHVKKNYRESEANFLGGNSMTFEWRLHSIFRLRVLRRSAIIVLYFLTFILVLKPLNWIGAK